jgi:hypothetical protein
MSLYAFSDSMIAGCIRAGDSAKFGIDLINKREQIVTAVKARANDLLTPHPPHSNSTFRNRQCVVMHDYPTVIVIRCLTKFLARRFRVEMQSRDEIIRTVITTLADTTPFYVIKRDVSNFYETVDIRQLRTGLYLDQSISENAHYHLRAYFSRFCAADVGIPRGLGLSALIGEWALQDYDKRISRVNGVYRYFRFCDDILIFSVVAPELISGQIDTLPAGLHFNESKNQDFPVQKGSPARPFDFLGYSFRPAIETEKDRPRKISVEISDKAIRRMKSKVALAVAAYNEYGDFPLLFDRLRYLSGNYRVMRQGITHNKDAKYIKAGIHYSYKFCGTYEGTKKVDFDDKSLNKLDTFLHTVRKSKRNSLSRFFSNSLSAAQHKKLAGISFKAGFVAPIFIRYDDSRVAEVNSIWKSM